MMSARPAWSHASERSRSNPPASISIPPLLAHQIEDGSRTGIRLAALVRFGRRRINEMEIGEALRAELLSNGAERNFGI